ncbi:MAG: hypothetical protein ACKOI0_07120 [Actinomycetota bacterium]
MFVRYYLDLALPFGSVEAAVLRDAAVGLPSVAAAADEQGDRLLAEVGFGDGHRIEKRIELHVGEPAHLRGTTLLPMTWKATGTDSVFPALEADLELAPMGPDRTQVSISARYRPPLGGLGRALDRALLHRVAEATIKDFLDRVGDRLAHEAVAPGA